MKRKIVIVVFIVMLLSGCSINYNLDISDDKIIETTTMIQGSNDTYSDDYLMSSYNQEYPIFSDEEFLYYAPTDKVEGNTYYDKTINDNNGTYTAKYVANYDFDNFKRSRAIDTAYKLHAISYDSSQGYYFIQANNFKIFDYNKSIDNITVSINLNDYEVVESNHHSKDGSKYIWNFDRNSQGTINIKFKKQKNNLPTTPSSSEKPTENKKNKPDYTMYIFSGILLIVFLIGYGIFKIITSKEDSIE